MDKEDSPPSDSLKEVPVVDSINMDMDPPFPVPGDRLIDGDPVCPTNNLPTPTIITANTVSASYMTRGNKGRIRHHHWLKHVGLLLKSCDILCLQELRVDPESVDHFVHDLERYFPNHKVFPNFLRKALPVL